MEKFWVDTQAEIRKKENRPRVGKNFFIMVALPQRSDISVSSIQKTTGDGGNSADKTTRAIHELPLRKLSLYGLPL